MRMMLIGIHASFVLLLSVAGLEACNSDQGTGAAASPARVEAPGEPSAEPSPTNDSTSTQLGEASGTVHVAPQGTKFDPAVKPEQIPDGAWMCEMGGAVHYAAMEQGDGKCPICGMALRHKTGPHAHADGHPGGDEDVSR